MVNKTGKASKGVSCSRKEREKSQVAWIRTVAAGYLWDFPKLVDEPYRITKAIRDWKRGTLSPEEEFIIRTLERRLSRTDYGRKIYRKLFGKEPPPPIPWMIPPEELFG